MNQEYVDKITNAHTDMLIDMYLERQSYKDCSELPESEIARMVEEEKLYEYWCRRDLHE